MGSGCERSGKSTKEMTCFQRSYGHYTVEKLAERQGGKKKPRNSEESPSVLFPDCPQKKPLAPPFRDRNILCGICIPPPSHGHGNQRLCHCSCASENAHHMEGGGDDSCWKGEKGVFQLECEVWVQANILCVVRGSSL